MSTGMSNCRFYEGRFPQVDDVIMVNVRSIEEMGAYVTLLEYNGIEGMILLSELSRRRIRSINKLIRVGRNEVVVVQRVDEVKGYIDLSKRRVSPEEAALCEERYGKGKTIHSILRAIADTLRVDLEDLYMRTAWKLKRVYGDYFEAFRQSVTAFDEVFSHCEVTEDEKRLLKASITRRLAIQPLKIRADLEVTCYEYEGVDAIKAALSAGIQTDLASPSNTTAPQSTTDSEIPLKINLIAPPLYVLTITTLDKAKGIEKINIAIDAIKKSILAAGGACEILKEARVANAVDDKQLQEMLDEENQNSGSSDDDEDSDDNDNDKDE